MNKFFFKKKGPFSASFVYIGISKTNFMYFRQHSCCCCCFVVVVFLFVCCCCFFLGGGGGGVGVWGEGVGFAFEGHY